MIWAKESTSFAFIMSLLGANLLCVLMVVDQSVSLAMGCLENRCEFLLRKLQAAGSEVGDLLGWRG